MGKRMSKMEACHHLTVLRDALLSDVDRMKKSLESDTEAPLHKSYAEKRMAEALEQIRALEMAGAGLTR